MKLSVSRPGFAISFSAYLLCFSLAIFTSVARSQNVPAPTSSSESSATKAATPENAPDPSKVAAADVKKAEESEDETGAFRHSPVVQSIARILHLPVETTAKICEYLNFAVIAFSFIYVIFKFLPSFFRNRKAGIQKQLVDARSATEVAKERLDGVEQRLARLDQDIDAIRKQVEQDAAQDELRIKASLEEERVRIVESAGHEIEAAGAAAQRELKRFAAELAIDRATDRLSLTPETDRKLVHHFAQGLGDGKQGGRN